MQSQLLRVSEFCERYAVSRATFYRLVKRGDLTVYKVGCASRVKVTEAEAWLDSLTNLGGNSGSHLAECDER